ncbi:MAG: hypothetical protein MZW92_15640 [Comamonadaceae bacterium]|nr:hypothetical protein [Comamonadaceae bacterium]
MAIFAVVIVALATARFKRRLARATGPMSLATARRQLGRGLPQGGPPDHARPARHVPAASSRPLIQTIVFGFAEVLSIPCL